MDKIDGGTNGFAVRRRRVSRRLHQSNRAVQTFQTLFRKSRSPLAPRFFGFYEIRFDERRKSDVECERFDAVEIRTGEVDRIATVLVALIRYVYIVSTVFRKIDYLTGLRANYRAVRKSKSAESPRIVDESVTFTVYYAV